MAAGFLFLERRGDSELRRAKKKKRRDKEIKVTPAGLTARYVASCSLTQSLAVLA